MTENLRDLLERAAPHDPGLSPAERSDAVVRRGRAARRRNRALVAAAGVAVLVAAAAVPVALRGDGDDGRPDTATQPPTPATTASACPAQPVPVDRPGASLDLGDVVAVRSCPAAGADGEPLPSQPVIGVMAAAFAEDVEALPAYRLPELCAAALVAQEPWALQVETADGSTYFLGSTTRACSSITVGGVERGTDAVVAAFLGNLLRQESGIPGLACPSGERLADGAPTWNASFDPSTAIAGVVCYRVDPLGAREYPAREGRLTAEELDAVRDGLAGDLQPPDDGTCIDTGPQRMVLLLDGSGDQAAWVDDHCTGVFAGPHGSWRPGPEAEQAIAAALSR
ncbi:hypothetical protein [Nocardioides pyridinolyticus]